MAAIVWADVTSHASSLSTIDANAQTDILAYVNSCLVVDEFGGESSTKLRLARIYLAAHIGTLSQMGENGGSGSVISKTLGDASISFGNVSSFAESSSYSGTLYGQMFLSIVKSTPARAGVLL